jgi:hypothetical protein
MLYGVEITQAYLYMVTSKQYASPHTSHSYIPLIETLEISRG